MPKRVLVTDSLQEIGVEALRAEGLEVEVVPTLPPAELAHRLGTCAGLIVRSASKVTAEVIDAAPGLEVIGRAGVGLDNVDVEAATRRGIVCMNTPGGNTIAAAEHTFALLLACARRLPQAHGHLKGGKWEREAFLGAEVYGKTLGVVGLGRIGAEVARRGLAFGMRVLAVDPVQTRAPDGVAALWRLDRLADLLGASDFVVIAAPHTPQTARLFDRTRLRQMKPTGYLINIGRGAIVVLADLVAALRAGELAGAGLDVFEVEPLPADHPLWSMENVILTPHVAGNSPRIAERHLAVLLDNVGRFARGESLENVASKEAWF